MARPRSRTGTVNPVVLLILDGFGLRKSRRANAIAAADTPSFSLLFKERPWISLDPTGRAVGLPAHQMGTSEGGHLTLGAGRVVDQDLVRINRAIKDRSLFRNKAIRSAMLRARDHGKALHLLGLCSDGGVHSHINHLFALLEMARFLKVRHLFVHAITDGRDAPPRSAKRFLAAIQKKCLSLGIGEIATVMGRYYAMDRDARWDRERQAYMALVQGEGPIFPSPTAALDDAYSKQLNDEFVRPCLVRTRDHRSPFIIDGDSLLFFNFRQDRARELSHGFTDEHFAGFRRRKLDLLFVTMTSYDEKLHVPVAFPEILVRNTLAECLAHHGVRQLHMAETEKYGHVTYFLNGGRERPFPQEERIMIPSKRDVSSYAEAPKMSAIEITDRLVAAMRSGRYGFIVANLANADEVGHTGDLRAAIKAVECLDACVSKVVSEAHLRKQVVLITADHGNAEEMSGTRRRSHTLNPVPLLLIDPTGQWRLKGNGRLADVAPTALTLMGLQPPAEMTGNVLVSLDQVQNGKNIKR